MKQTNDELSALFADARQKVPIGTVWKHKKGGEYMILGHGFDTELGRINVHYFRIGGPDYDKRKETGIVFDRPLFLWTEDRFTQVNVFRTEQTSDVSR